MTDTTSLQLGISAIPDAICVDRSTLCSAATGESVVTMTAFGSRSVVPFWPSVQVAFVIETAPYDGVFDVSAGDPGTDPCAALTGIPCEESNGVPFFVSHAQQIAAAVAAANPHSNVSFAMVDYFATLDSHDDSDGSEYHVDIPQFVRAGDFGPTVATYFQGPVLSGGYTYSDSDFGDNTLHSSVITALFGTIVGSGLDWSPKTHHVIVWMGDTAPRDPNYVQDYTVAPPDDNFGMSGACEPSYSFPSGSSPECEGWLHTQDGNATDSIARLARSAPTCTGAIGAVCTVDMLDLYSTPTDPYSPGWPCDSDLRQAGGCPGGPAVRSNVANVLEAGCDMAAATGGSWDGPSFYSCPNGQAGQLQAVFVGPNAGHPNLDNPSLFNAFRRIGFGPLLGSQVANGTHQPIFQYVPIGAIRVVPNQHVSATCLKADGTHLKTCDHTPVVVNRSGLLTLGWNWSTRPDQNQMYLGDLWTVSFLVYASGPPLAVVPVDACTTDLCKAAGSGAIDRLFTWANYIPGTNRSIVTQSFSFAAVDVIGLAGTPPPPVVPPPPATIPPPFATPVSHAVPVLTAIGISAQVAAASISLQAAVAGLLGAGFLRIATRVRPIANPVLASAQKPASSLFDPELGAGSGLGRFE